MITLRGLTKRYGPTTAGKSTTMIPAGRVDEVLAAVGPTAVAGKRAGAFSLGMGQRLSIAGAPIAGLVAVPAGVEGSR